MTEAEQRVAVIAEAERWLGTPYHSAARLCGVGCDCLTFPVEVYAAAGVIPRQALPYYPPDWHLHRSDDRYLAGVLKVATEIEVPQPGDFALWRVGRALAHGAIVIAWPRIIHAVQGIGVIEDRGDAPALRFDPRPAQRVPASAREREHHFYSPWVTR